MEQDIQLLYEYLTKLFKNNNSPTPESDAEQMIMDNSNNLFGYHGLAWELGKIDLEFFCMYFLQDTYLPKEDNTAAPIAPVHRELWHDIQESIIGDGDTQIGRIYPRGTGKSAFGNFGPTVWAHCYKHRKYTLICSNISTTAEKFVADIKNQFLENKYLESAFGKLLDPSNRDYKCNSTQLEFLNRTSVEAISSTSPMRGRKYDNIRPDFIILDDYQSDDDVKTEESREKKWKRYSDDVKYAIQKTVMRGKEIVKKGTVLVALGTIQHKECFYSRLMKLPTWKFKHEKGVLVDDIDEMFNSGLWLEFKNILFNFKNENRLEDAKEFYWSHEEEMKYPILWESFWDCLQMALDYYENPVSFKQEVQNDADSIGEVWFKFVRTEARSEIETHEFIKTMLCCDPASTNNKKSDYSAFLVGSVATNGNRYARKAELAKISARTDFDKYVNHMVELLLEYRDITHVYIEKNTFNGADANQLEKAIEEHEILRYRDITIVNESQRKNKDDKISTIIPVINQGLLIFAEEDEEFINQIKDFRGQKYSLHDDAPDITSEFENRIHFIEEVNDVELFDKRQLFGVG